MIKNNDQNQAFRELFSVNFCPSLFFLLSDKLQQESIVGSLNETNAKLQSKVTQLEEANQGMRRKFESLELKSHEELDSLRGELKEARVQMDVLKSVSGVHNSGEHGTKDEATVQNRPYVQLQSEILEAQKQIKQKDEVIKILQDQLNVFVSNEADNSLNDLKTKSQSTEAHSLHASDWMQSYDDDGNVYFYNTRTQESSWDPPPGFS